MFSLYINILGLNKGRNLLRQFVLFGFRVNLASHFARSPSNHSYHYAFSDDRPNYLARFSLNPEPFVKYAG